MGNRCRHRLTVYGVGEPVLREIGAFIAGDEDMADVFDSGRNGNVFDAAGEAKWYSYDEDMKALAARFPAATFVLERRGDDDMNARVFTYGKQHGAPTRDGLLAEIRRSLMATHPDRAEALCAALEREFAQADALHRALSLAVISEIREGLVQDAALKALGIPMPLEDLRPPR